MSSNPTPTVVSPRGSLTADRCDDLRATLLEHLDAGATRLVLDFSAVDMIDSRGLGVLVQCHQSLAERKGSITVTNASDDIQRVFRVTRLDGRFNIPPAAEAA